MPCGRGLPTPCAVSCTVNWRLCRACCAAVATFQETTSAAGTTEEDAESTTEASGESGGPAAGETIPPREQLVEDRDKALREASRCLAVCSSLPSKRIRAFLEDPPESSDDFTKLVAELAAVNSKIEWDNFFKNAYSRPFSTSLVCNQLSC